MVSRRQHGRWEWTLLLTLLAACSGETSREPPQIATATPVAAITPTSAPSIPTAPPVVTAVRPSIPMPSPTCVTIDLPLKGYSTPSPAESVAFLSDPDPANGGV